MPEPPSAEEARAALSDESLAALDALAALAAAGWSLAVRPEGERYEAIARRSRTAPLDSGEMGDHQRLDVALCRYGPTAAAAVLALWVSAQEYPA